MKKWSHIDYQNETDKILADLRAYEKAGNTNEQPICPVCDEEIEENGLCYCDVREALGLPDFC